MSEPKNDATNDSPENSGTAAGARQALVPDLATGKVVTIQPKDIGKVQKVTIEEKREDSATTVAVIITGTFAVSTALLLIGIFLVVTVAPDKAKNMIDIATPILKEASSFLSTVFGPLLAFILGYYFSKSERSASSKSSDSLTL